MHDLSSTDLLFARLSLVKTLLLANNHKKIGTLEGTWIFHITGVNTCLTPLSLTTTNKDCSKYLPQELNWQIMESFSLVS
jgi:hypothetical protein